MALVLRAEVSRARALLKISECNPTDQRITEAYRATHAELILSYRGKKESPAAAISIAIAAMRMLRYELAERASPDCPPAGNGSRGRARSDDSEEEEDEEDEEDAEDAEVDASNSETEAEVRPPAGRGVPKKRKRKTGRCRQAEAAARNAPESKKGGFINRGRRTFRDNQGALVTGTKRSCLPDGLWMALVEANCEVELENVRSIMPEDENEDTPFAAAQDYAAELGFELACVSKEMQKDKGGYAFNLFARDHGYFLVQLRVTTGPTDPEPPDLHVVLYDGKTVRDNNKYTKVKT